MSLLEVRGLRFRYLGAAEFALRGIDLRVEEGELVALTGASGCGKSTLLRCLNGLIPHLYKGEYDGRVLLDGLEVHRTPPRLLAQRVGLLFQDPEHQLFRFTVEEDVAFGPENLGLRPDEVERRVREALSALGIEHLAQRSPYELSDGQRQLVALAGVLAVRPRLVLLDEPTSMLSPRAALALLSLVASIRRRERTAFIVVEHRLELLAALADRLIVMHEGAIVADGSPAELLADASLEGLGVRIPAVPKLASLLRRGGLPLDGPCLTPEALAQRLNALLA